ncbi:DNA-3-methyladenine glycosylase 2 family protein [Robertmurraya kyonggiensis]|uniref:DNA-3-methyladenine glycosylase II n=2 Tax=Robertmurraya kyonggiensis TaxID=1037680 RepID=A0A4U1D666_9BACI|nr:DNA-3-methyladenine glycosylase 2 family protein [Robertmurraya kyonggiensis]
MHRIKDGYLYKLVKLNGEVVLMKIGSTSLTIQVEFPMGQPSVGIHEKVATFIWDWFDFDQALGDFYDVARTDTILKRIVPKYNGLRIMGIPDLFEALAWAIIGQQINLTFAYTLKKRFVEQYGESYVVEGCTYWLFPEHTKIASLEVDELRKLQFTSRKAEYIIGIAKAMASGELSKEILLQKQDFKQIQRFLISFRGIGAWTADYVRMRCLHDPSAFPIADVGLHHALMHELRMERKPTIEEIEEISTNWAGWQAYATFYLWRSLYAQTP